VSPQAKDLISQLLVTDPEKRLTADHILAHEWMAESGMDDSEEESNDSGDMNDVEQYDVGMQEVA